MASSQRTQNDIENELLNALTTALKVKDDGGDNIIEVHEKALEDLVNVNSLFTIAVFVGLSFAAPNQHSLENRSECDPDPEMAKRLILSEVVSFACFLLSSLTAKALKVLLNLEHIKTKIDDIPVFSILLSETWRRFLLALSIVASFLGIVLLMLSMVEVIQIRVGRLSCGSEYALHAVGTLCAIVLAALLLYAPSMVYAVIASAPTSKKIDESISMQGQA